MPRPKTNVRETSVSDQPIHITEWRRMGASDPAVVLVHGGAQGSGVRGETHFSKQSELAAKGWRILVPDRPGSGRSPARGVPDDPQIDGIWVSELLGDGAHLLGHSFGGAVALAVAAMRPQAVKSLTLIEPALQALTFDNPHTQTFIGQIIDAMTAGSPAETARRFNKLAAIPSFLRGEASEAELEALGKGLLEIKVPALEAVTSELAAVKAAGIPLLTISGGWSPSIQATAMKAAELGGGRHVEIKSEHHFPQLVSDEFNQVFADFMSAAERRKM